MTEPIPFSSETVKVLERLLAQSARQCSSEMELKRRIQAWAGGLDGLKLLEYVAEGGPGEVTEWFSTDDALSQQLAALTEHQMNTDPSTNADGVSLRLETASQQMDQELRRLRMLLPIARQLLQAERQAADLRSKLAGTHGLGKLWGTLTGRQNALSKELEWVEKQVQRMKREYRELQTRQAIPVSARDVQAHFEQRVKEWNTVLTGLHTELAAARTRESALEKRAAEKRDLRDQQRNHRASWTTLVQRYDLPAEPMEWLKLTEGGEQARELWRAFLAFQAEHQETLRQLERQWQTWPAEEQNEAGARARLEIWHQRQVDEQHDVQEARALAAVPLLPWGDDSPFLSIPPTVRSEVTPVQTAAEPLLPWGTLDAGRPLADQSDHAGEHYLNVRTKEVPITDPATPIVEGRPTDLQSGPADMIPLLSLNTDLEAPSSHSQEVFPPLLSPHCPDMSSSGSSEVVETEAVLPWIGTLPDLLNVASEQTDFLDDSQRTQLTTEERTRQIAVKVAVETDRQEQINFIEDHLAGGFAALKAPRLERQLLTLSEDEIELVEQLYEWWPGQTHYGATYRLRNREWKRAGASISRQTCEQLVRSFTSVPCFEEITQLLEDLHEHLGYGRVAFAYQVQTILDELPGDVDFESWVTWIVSVAAPQDGDDWADEVDFQNLMRHL